MKILSNQKGFGVAEVVLILAVLGLVGFIGWRLYDQTKKDSNTSTTQTDSSGIPAINKAEDLDSAVDTLNNQNIDEQLDTSEMDAALAE